ncbi:MAG: hypothetical protein J5846_07820 [Desulfovibrio sp.]|nr:hypothetical protein [Desulfovibrio sp.]
MLNLKSDGTFPRLKAAKIATNFEPMPQRSWHSPTETERMAQTFDLHFLESHDLSGKPAFSTMADLS